MMQIPVALGLCLKYFVRDRVLCGLPKQKSLGVQNLRSSFDARLAVKGLSYQASDGNYWREW